MSRMVLLGAFLAVCQGSAAGVPRQSGQDPQEGVGFVVAWVMQRNGEEEAQAESLLAHYEALAENPVPLNWAKRADFEALGFLSEYHVVALLDYREQFGLFYSWQEIPLIPGFSQETVWLLQPFFTLPGLDDDNPQGNGQEWPGWKYGRRTLLLYAQTNVPRAVEYAPITAEEYAKKPNARYLGIPWSRYGKYAYSNAGRIKWGVTVDADAGERSWADFVSVHMQLKDVKRIKSLVVGDFQARFGQGLLVWNGTMFGSATRASGVRMQEMGLTSYTSRNECLFFRGAGVTVALGRWTLSAFGSYKKLDARLTEEGFTSFHETGMHRTPSERAKKRTLGGWVTGVNASYNGTSWKVGVTGLGYGYDHPNARNVLYYNEKQSRAVPFGGVSVDGSYRWPSWRLFGEAAVDAAGGMAALAGLIGYGENGAEMSVLLRGLGAAYTAAYGTAVGRNSTSSNELSIQLMGNVPLGKEWVAAASAYVAYFPQPRYGCRVPSYGWDWRGWVQHRVFSALLRQRRTLYGGEVGLGPASAQPTDSYSLRLQGQANLGKGFLLDGRIEGKCLHTKGMPVDWGRLAYAELKYKSLSHNWAVVIRAEAYHTDSWDARMFAYESDVLNGFSVPALYGKGIRGYVTLRVSPWSWLDVWVKGGYTQPLPEEKGKAEIKIQARLLW